MNNEISKNNILNDQIKQLKTDLYIEKNKNKNLENEFRKEIKNLKEINKELDNQLNNETIKSKNIEEGLQKEVNNLTDINKKLNFELNDEKNKSKNLEDNLQKEINKLVEINKQLGLEINNEKKKLIDIEEKYSNKDIEVNKLNKNIFELNDKIKELNKENNISNLISVIFTTYNKTIFYSDICEKTSKFIQLEEKFYNKYPEYYKHDNCFKINGNEINRFKTMEENKIKNSDIIILS